MMLDEEREGETYLMRYLPDGLLEDPADEEITLAQLQKRKKKCSTTNQHQREIDEKFLNAEEHAK
jgi:hypothetical protein